MSKKKLPLDGCQTVGELVTRLLKFDQTLPVLAAYTRHVRMNEYFEVVPELSNLDDQETGGDPLFYGKQVCVVLR